MTYSDTGIILKRRDFGEADRLYSIYTREHGKIEAIAQGARKIRSKLAAHLEPLTFGEFMFANGRRIERLIQARAQESFSVLKNNLPRLGQANFIADVLDNLTKQGVRDWRVFNLLQESLVLLNGQAETTGLEQCFVIKLLQLLGFELILDHCVGCKKELAPSSVVTINPLKGGVLCANCRMVDDLNNVSMSPDALEIMRRIFTEREFVKIAYPSDQVYHELKEVADIYLQNHWGLVPKSKKFLEFVHSYAVHYAV